MTAPAQARLEPFKTGDPENWRGPNENPDNGQGWSLEALAPLCESGAALPPTVLLERQALIVKTLLAYTVDLCARPIAGI